MQTANSSGFFALVSNALDGDIAVFHIDAQSGHIEPVTRCAAGEAVMPMARPDAAPCIYAATRGSSPALVKCSFDPHTGNLTHERTVSIASSMAYTSIDPGRRYLFAASYGDDLLNVYSLNRLDSDGAAPLQSFDRIKHAHAAVVSPDGHFVYVSSLGSDRIVCFRIGEEQPDAPLAHIGNAALEPQFGPRHMRFSPDGDWLYVLSEFHATVASFRRNVDTGSLTLTSVSARPAAVSKLRDGQVRHGPANADRASMIWASDIHARPDGRFLYVAERTTSRLIIFKVHADGATLEDVGYVDTETQPRGFNIDPTGRFLVACGEQSVFVSVYGIDANTGALTHLSRCEGGRGANWIELVNQRAVQPD